MIAADLQAEGRRFAERHGLHGASAKACAMDFASRLAEERVRVAAIMCSTEAKSRHGLAKFIATETGCAIEDAKRMLDASAVELSADAKEVLQ